MIKDVPMSDFARTIMHQKYSHQLADGPEGWGNIAYRATKHPMKAIGYTMRDGLSQDICKTITERKFVPAGRYLYASGRSYHQVQNCVLLGVHDSREGWSDLLHKSSMALMTGAGIGVEYSDIRGEGAKIRRTGGFATGPIALMQMLNECGRGIMQGGSRRSAIWAGLRWDHPDIMKFIHIKDWPQGVRELKAKDFNFPATLDCTNISVGLNDEFFKAYHDDEHPKHTLAQSVYWETIRQMLKTGEPGFSINLGRDSLEIYRNAPVVGGTKVLTPDGHVCVGDVVDKPITVWTGEQWAPTVFKQTGENVPTVTVMFSLGSITCDPSHEFLLEVYEGHGKERGLKEIRRTAASNLKPGDDLRWSLPLVSPQKFSSRWYTNGFVFGDGSINKYGGGELTLCTSEKKHCLDFMDCSMMTSINMDTPGGYTRTYFKAGIFQGFVKSMVPSMTLEESASWLAGMFDADGSYQEEGQRVRLSQSDEGFLGDVQGELFRFGILSTISGGIKSGFGGADCSNLSIRAESVQNFLRLIPTKRLQLRCEDYVPYRPSPVKVLEVVEGSPADVYCCDVKVPEHSFCAEGVIIANCTEVSSKDTDDICNLGSINLARVDSLDEFESLVEMGTIYLLAGSLYSDVPYSAIDRTRTKNRRLGLGLMGVHEWLLKRGKPYAPDHELWKWLEVYQKSTKFAHEWADELGVSRPVKTRAIAPTGTTSIVAETTSGIEPIFCVAYKRRYLKHNTWHYQYVVDPTAARLIAGGIDLAMIEDAYDLSVDVERRVEFQSWMQQAVDHGISSTVNLPHWGSEQNNESTVRPFGTMLMKHLPKLRGITVYPDGARDGQPLTPVAYKEAMKHSGKELVEEATDICDITKGGSCGD
jgi:ribonucleotide reductase alpha subunit